jgi:hypothetical protein
VCTTNEEELVIDQYLHKVQAFGEDIIAYFCEFQILEIDLHQGETL